MAGSSTANSSAAELKVVNDAGAQPVVAPLLSEYEQWRARNIERNNARLRQLGLIGQEEERLSNALAWGHQRQPSSSHRLPRNRDAGIDDENKEGVLEKDTRKRSRKAKTISSPPPRREGSRKSRRLANQTASGDDDDDNSNNNSIEEWKSDNKTLSSTEERRAALVAECREARQRAAIEVAKAGFQMAAKENPTASYEHCLMRVRSMTEKALAARVRRIIIACMIGL